MKKYILPIVIAMAAATGLSSCTGLLMSSDFGYDSYGPPSDYYWPNYGGIYNPPLGYYGPAWGVPVPPGPPYPAGPQLRPQQPQQPNGANRPNYVPSSGQNQSKPVTTTPTGAQRPGNMGQGPSHSTPSSSQPSGSGSHRGR